MSIDQQNGYIAGMTSDSAYACSRCPNCTCAQRTAQAKVQTGCGNQGCSMCEMPLAYDGVMFTRDALAQPNVMATGTTVTGTYAKPPRTFTREEVIAALKAQMAHLPEVSAERPALRSLVRIFERME